MTELATKHPNRSNHRQKASFPRLYKVYAEMAITQRHNVHLTVRDQNILGIKPFISDYTNGTNLDALETSVYSNHHMSSLASHDRPIFESAKTRANPRFVRIERHLLLPPSLTNISSCAHNIDGDTSGDKTVAKRPRRGLKTVRRSVKMGEELVLREYYRAKFEEMQQVPCKVIVKAWIKLIQRKKQSDNPYNGGKKARALGYTENGGEVTAPLWWAPLDLCRHREPDHLVMDGK